MYNSAGVVTKAYILHENPEWVVPLKAELDNLGVPHADWLLDGGTVPLDDAPPEGVFYNRMSASSHTRNHRHAPELALATLNWLELHERRVLNRRGALHLEVNKMAQYRALKDAGVRVPRTVAAVGEGNLPLAAEQLGMAPFLIKPNRGGKGAGVRLFNSVAELVDHAREVPEAERPIDGVWLVQQYIKPSDNRITRCELVDRELLYAVLVDTSDGFELCPADVCRIEDAPGGANFEVDPASAGAAAEANKFVISREFSEPELIAGYQRVMRDNHIHIAAFEFVRGADGATYTYDLNTNTNYNQRAELEAGVEVGGMARIARYLGRELERIKA